MYEQRQGYGDGPPSPIAHLRMLAVASGRGQSVTRRVEPGARFFRLAPPNPLHYT
jgi:hypothetical protein